MPRIPALIVTAFTLVAGATMVLSGDDRARICHPGFAAAGRPSPEAWLKLRREVFRRAGVNFAMYHADFETDHIIPRCLDGPNTLDNLQLQLWPRARIKDLEEVETCRAYCAGKLTLPQARGRFKRDAP